MNNTRRPYLVEIHIGYSEWSDRRAHERYLGLVDQLLALLPRDMEVVYHDLLDQDLKSMANRFDEPEPIPDKEQT